MSQVAVAVSGGADSLYALMRLCEAGHTVFALHGRFLAPLAGEADPVPALTAACAALGVPLHCVDLTAFFDTAVIAPFVRAYACGETPNPCALCNVRVKFGALWDAALALGASAWATGHYAAFMEHPQYGRVLAQAADTEKDQSYFLALVPAGRLAKVHFPLARVRKEQAVKALQRRGIAVPVPRASQDICFVRGHYTDFLVQAAARLGIELSGPGPIVFQAKNATEHPIGRHSGLWRYTEGQRRGLGIAHTAPLYVAAKDNTRNTLVLQTANNTTTICWLRDVLTHVPLSLWPEGVWVKTRYRQDLQPAAWRWDAAQDRLCVDFARSQSRAAPGQVAAVYDGDGALLAGGIVCR